MNITLTCLDPDFDAFIRVALQRAGMTILDDIKNESVVHRIIITSENTEPKDLKHLVEKKIANLTETEQQKIIVWNRTKEDNQELMKAIDRAINEMNFSGIYNIRSNQFIKVVDDIRFIIVSDQGKEESENFDIIFIYNILERVEAKHIYELLSTILNIACIEYDHEDQDIAHEALQEVQSTSRFYLFYSNQNHTQLVEQFQNTQNVLSNPDDCKFLLATDNLTDPIPLIEAKNAHTLSIESGLLPLEIKMQFDAMISGE